MGIPSATTLREVTTNIRITISLGEGAGRLSKISVYIHIIIRSTAHKCPGRLIKMATADRDGRGLGNGAGVAGVDIDAGHRDRRVNTDISRTGAVKGGDVRRARTGVA